MERSDQERLADRAYAALRKGRHLLALALTDQLVEADRKDPIYRIWRAHALLGVDQPEEAMAEARLGAEMSPDLFQAHLTAAWAAWKLGRADEAEKCYEKAIAASGREAFVLSEYANFLATDRPPDLAERAAREAVAADPASAEARSALGLALFRQKRHDEAEQTLRKALDLDPDSARAQAYMAMLLEATGRKRQAAALARMLGPAALAVRLPPHEPHAAAEEPGKDTPAVEPALRRELFAPLLRPRWLRWAWAALWAAGPVLMAVGLLLCLFAPGVWLIAGAVMVAFGGGVLATMIRRRDDFRIDR